MKMQPMLEKKTMIEIGLKYSHYDNKIILEAYTLNGKLNVGDIVEYQNDYAEVSKYHEDSDYYSLTCISDSAFSRAIGNIITVTIKK